VIRNEFYESPTQGDFEHFELGDLVLESGETLRGAKLAYRTFGTLNDDKSNAILVTTWFSGTGLVMEGVYVGEDHALDPSKYFIIIVDQLGAGSRPRLRTTPHHKRWASFPI
jgi:homoserine O-acetyltransferase